MLLWHILTNGLSRFTLLFSLFEIARHRPSYKDYILSYDD